MAITVNQKLTNAWTLSTGLSASVLNTSQYLFQSTQYSQITATAATPDELAAAVLAGTTYDNPQLASLLTGAPSQEDPARRQIYGDRILNAALQTTATYSRQRLTLAFSAGASRAQTLSTDTPEGVDRAAYRVPNSTSGQASVNIGYSLSPRTQFGVTMAASESVSRFGDSYTPTFSAHIGRRMSMRWMLDLHGGTGLFISRRDAGETPNGPQYLSGGTLGYKTGGHTILFSVDRSISSQLGLGSTTNLSGMAAWNWAMPGRSWKVMAAGGYQRRTAPALTMSADGKGR